MLKSMNISFTVNEAYVKYLTVAMRSILDNAEDGEEFRFYVINSGIGEDSKRKLESLKSIRDFYIEYIALSAGDIPPIPENSNAHVSQETNFRLRISSLKPELDKILCLDCDLVAVSSLWNLYNTNIDGYYAACAVDAPSYGGCNDGFMSAVGLKQYYNTGVCLINLKVWRENGVEKKIFDGLSDFAGVLRFPDQDLLNIALKDHVLEIDHQWNLFVGCLDLFYPAEVQKFILKNPKIIHWAGKEKPWKYPEIALSDYFWKYARQTPFYEEILQKGLFPPQQQVQQVIREVPAVREKIGYVDDYLLTKLKYAKYKLLSKILFGKKRVSCRQKRKELKREMKRIKSCYRMQEAEKKAADF